MNFKTVKPIFVVNLLILFLLFLGCKSVEKLPDPLQAGWKGKKVCEVVEENKSVRVLKCTFPPNVGHEKHYHNSHFGYTLSGGIFRITDTTGTREVDVPKGYHFSNDVKTIHEVLNIGETTAVFLIVEYK